MYTHEESKDEFIYNVLSQNILVFGTNFVWFSFYNFINSVVEFPPILNCHVLLNVH